MNIDRTVMTMMMVIEMSGEMTLTLLPLLLPVSEEDCHKPRPH